MATNLQIKFIRSLQLKKNRDFHQTFVCEGVKIVTELLSQDVFEPIEIFATKSWAYNVSNPKIRTTFLTETQMSQISQLQSPPEVLALVRYPTTLKPFVQNQLSIYLDSIADPGNLGTIIRTADWFGIHQIFLSPNCVNLFNSKVVQATMGSIFRGRFEVILLSDLLSKYSFAHILGAVLNGETLQQAPISTNSLIVLGSESHGIASDNIQLLTHSITIDRMGSAESLNVTVATGIILYALTNKLM